MSEISSQSCRVGFISRWSLENHLWGVEFTANGLEIDRKKFSCCSGDGIFIESIEIKTAKLCGLKRRWHLLNSLFQQSGLGMDQCPGFWNQILLKSTVKDKSAMEHEVRSLVGAHLDRWLNTPKGALFSSRFPGMGASVLGASVTTLVASILSWHFERVALIARPGEMALPINLWQELLQKHPKAAPLILVEAPQDLWNASKLEPMEAVIAFAYERKIPLWIHSVSGGTSPQALSEGEGHLKSRSFRQSVSRRLESARGKGPLEWLSQQSLSRLSEICDVPIAPLAPSSIPEFI